MALLHQAELRPTKLELIGGWAPSQPWFTGEAGELTSVGAYRFDDPAGEVGVETLLVQAKGGPVLHVPLTYRATPLVDADDSLIGTLQHSVLGTRWVYDGVGDPVYLQTVAAAVIGAESQVEQYFEVDGERVYREPTAKVVGSGIDGVETPGLPEVSEITISASDEGTVAETGSLRITVRRALDGAPSDLVADGVLGALSGTWTDQTEPQQLVFVSAR
jgi:hypothetical protein